ncbi:hypothetical protein AJ78_07813 [Emergomyces pasteurianus Ep9510]|uniref:Rhodopsin domain-containing protein n=1 Tax=Emergomyces pasteurianus Ep9510 TaxID=1447872 RepID=A0A1J9P3W1_9EURO|nr:hypothetical protein AJ78_07813 [Emergomyces pasteurianus Ep9510]
MYRWVTWTLWGIGVATTIGRAILRFQVQKTYLAEDYLAFICLIFLTAVTGLGTILEPTFGDIHSCLMNAERVDINLKVAISADVGSDLLSTVVPHPLPPTPLTRVSRLYRDHKLTRPVMILPLFLLMKARISAKQKLGLACMFSLGLIIIVIAFVRLSEIKKVIGIDERDDTVLIQAPIRFALWSQIEGSIALLVTNIPAFRSLIAPPGGISIRPANQYCGRPSFPQLSRRARAVEGSDVAGQKRTSKPRLSRPSLEMHNLHSESSSDGNPEELGEGQAQRRSTLAILRTTEVNIQSHMRDDERYVSHPFVPPA